MDQLPLLDRGSWLAFVTYNSVQHDFVWVLWCIGQVSLTPIITDRICKDVSRPVKTGCRNGAAGGWIAFKSVLGIFIPEVECAVRACCAESTVDRVDGDGVDRVDICDVA